MRMNKRASLEIGVNTIVILVIAMMLLGLGIGFVKGLFGKANTLPELIDTNSWENPPTSSEPVRLTPSSIELKSGDAKDVKVGVYNTEAAGNFQVLITGCTGPKMKKADGTETTYVGIPVVSSLSSIIKTGESKGFKVIISAVDIEKIGTVDHTATKNLNLPQGKYICKLVAQKETSTVGTFTDLFDAQFIMTVTS